MRTVTIMFLMLLIGASVMAADGPFSKGSKSASGGITFTHLSGDAYHSTTRISINPRLTTCVAPGLFVGGIVMVDYQKIEFDYVYGGSSTVDHTSWLLGFTMEKYFITTSNQFSHKGFVYPFLKMMAGLGKDEDITLTKFGGSLGGIFMIANNTGVDLSFSLTYDNYSYNGNSTSGLSFQAGAGFSYFIF